MQLSETSPTVSDDRYPWQRAYAYLDTLGLKPGLRVSTDDLYAAMGIPKFPDRLTHETDHQYAKRVQRWSLTKFLPELDTLKTEVLNRNGLWLRSRSRRHAEWEFLAAESASLVVKQATQEVKSTLRSASTTLAGMSTDACSDAERADHANAIAKVAHMETLMRMSPRK